MINRKYYKVGATYGHQGCGRGIDVLIPMYAASVFHCVSRIRRMGGLKKSIKNIKLIQEIDALEFLELRAQWRRRRRMLRKKQMVN
jgi:hypothetical protein